MSQAMPFFDDFSDPEMARYYETSDGLGDVARALGGLRYVIAPAPDPNI
jgi:hypothetical protein